MLSAPIDIDATDDFTTAANTGDPEAEISYAFVDESDAPAQTLGDFTIDAATGVITVATAPTFSLTATENTRTLTIRATDTSTGATGQTAEADITIEVLPPNTIELETSVAGATTFTINESDDSSVDVTTISITTPGVTPAAANGIRIPLRRDLIIMVQTTKIQQALPLTQRESSPRSLTTKR